MIIYNVTYSVDKEIAEEWISWMKDDYVPGLLKTGLFHEYKILKVLTHDEDDTFSYAVQFYSNSIKQVQQYFQNYPDQANRYGERVMSYPTLLEEV